MSACGSLGCGHTMSLKEVHWKLTVEEYAARDSPESWTSPLPSPEASPVSVPMLVSTPTPSPPQPMQNLPLPTTLEIHHLLTPASALQLDFSFPSDAFRRNPQLTRTLLAAPACTPPRTALFVRIAAGLYKARVQIRHTAVEGEWERRDTVTVGDVLTTIQRELRQYDNGATPREAELYMRRRIETVNGYSERRSPETRAATVAAENKGGGRMVDHLLGHTMFAGLTPQSGQPEWWQLQLAIPERYAG
ncbi:hypothetical protein K438DRAFT_1832845 [Mycena galopus ATCC 62051]|nr:hypothetical protein K438DRAFT_1866881 [Mycena galopus ATCC 62051]KAF8189589.1 hypothetical protein K438DRAFT_1832845 [Mycena galopus ATCC 62051]